MTMHVEKGDGTPDKEAASFDDCFDALRMSLLSWHLSGDRLFRVTGLDEEAADNLGYL